MRVVRNRSELPVVRAEPMTVGRNLSEPPVIAGATESAMRLPREGGEPATMEWRDVERVAENDQTTYHAQSFRWGTASATAVAIGAATVTYDFVTDRSAPCAPLIRRPAASSGRVGARRSDGWATSARGSIHRRGTVLG